VRDALLGDGGAEDILAERLASLRVHRPGAGRGVQREAVLAGPRRLADDPWKMMGNRARVVAGCLRDDFIVRDTAGHDQPDDLLRVKVRRFRGRITVPVLTTDDRRVVVDSMDIASRRDGQRAHRRAATCRRPPSPLRSGCVRRPDLFFSRTGNPHLIEATKHEPKGRAGPRRHAGKVRTPGAPRAAEVASLEALSSPPSVLTRKL